MSSNSTYLGDTFAGGVVSMARGCKASISLVRKGVWSFEDLDAWLEACITNDPKYRAEGVKTIKDVAPFKMPLVNATPEGKAAYINSQTAAMLAELEAMKACNQEQFSGTSAPRYREEDFLRLSEKYGLGHNAVVNFLS